MFQHVDGSLNRRQELFDLSSAVTLVIVWTLLLAGPTLWLGQKVVLPNEPCSVVRGAVEVKWMPLNRKHIHSYSYNNKYNYLRRARSINIALRRSTYIASSNTYSCKILSISGVDALNNISYVILEWIVFIKWFLLIESKFIATATNNIFMHIIVYLHKNKDPD